MMRRACVALLCLLAVRCGGSGTATSPTSTTSSIPSSFKSASQQVTLTTNVITFSWTGTTGNYKLSIGSASGLSDVLTATVTDTTYTWTAPRTANVYYARVANSSGDTTPAQEIPVFTLDMRNVIDALYFGYGPMSDASAGAAPASSVAVWPDGATIAMLVTTEAGDASLTAARAFVPDYLAASSNFINVTIDTTTQTYKGVSLGALPANTVVVRVDNTICPQAGVIACAYYGPAPYGPGRSFVNQNAPATGQTAAAATAVAHEIGHAFGLHHLVMTSSGRQEFVFLMNPALATSSLSTVEKTAIAAARAGGIRPGWTRAQALAAGLVLPTTAGSAIGPSFIQLRDTIDWPSDVFIR